MVLVSHPNFAEAGSAYFGNENRGLFKWAWDADERKRECVY